ncbi:hypothetical protein [Ruegeria sp.]
MGSVVMTKALQDSYKGFTVLFLLNWHLLLSFAVTAFAMAIGAYFVGL